MNGSTSTDRTNYWEVVPKPAMRLALWMEADRMGWLLPALTDARFETQRDVVLNERRQSYENRPYGLASFALHQALFPYEHPYSWPTIGETADLHAASVDDARAFFARYYHPGNASLAVAGDVDTEEAVDLVAGLFGEIPGGAPVPPVVAPPVPPRARRLVLEDRVQLARLYLAWPSPALFADGDAELDLASDILAGGRTSRLYRRLFTSAGSRRSWRLRRRRASWAGCFRFSRRPRRATRSPTSRPRFTRRSAGSLPAGRPTTR